MLRLSALAGWKRVDKKATPSVLAIAKAYKVVERYRGRRSPSASRWDTPVTCLVSLSVTLSVLLGTVVCVSVCCVYGFKVKVYAF